MDSKSDTLFVNIGLNLIFVHILLLLTITITKIDILTASIYYTVTLFIPFVGIKVTSAINEESYYRSIAIWISSLLIQVGLVVLSWLDYTNPRNTYYATSIILAISTTLMIIMGIMVTHKNC